MRRTRAALTSSKATQRHQPITSAYLITTSTISYPGPSKLSKFQRNQSLHMTGRTNHSTIAALSLHPTFARDARTPHNHNPSCRHRDRPHLRNHDRRNRVYRLIHASHPHDYTPSPCHTMRRWLSGPHMSFNRAY